MHRFALATVFVSALALGGCQAAPSKVAIEPVSLGALDHDREGYVLGAGDPLGQVLFEQWSADQLERQARIEPAPTDGWPWQIEI